MRYLYVHIFFSASRQTILVALPSVLTVHVANCIWRAFLIGLLSEYAISLCIPRCIFFVFFRHVVPMHSSCVPLRFPCVLCASYVFLCDVLFSVGFLPISPSFRRGFTPFSMLQINKQCFFGGEGVTKDEKGVFVQTRSIIVSSKALVLLKCLNTFVHDCSQVRSLVGSLSYSLTRLSVLYSVRSLSISQCTDFAHTFLHVRRRLSVLASLLNRPCIHYGFPFFSSPCPRRSFLLQPLAFPLGSTIHFGSHELPWTYTGTFLDKFLMSFLPCSSYICSGFSPCVTPHILCVPSYLISQNICPCHSGLISTFAVGSLTFPFLN